jgi:hypothetical protein
METALPYSMSNHCIIKKEFIMPTLTFPLIFCFYYCARQEMGTLQHSIGNRTQIPRSQGMEKNPNFLLLLLCKAGNGNVATQHWKQDPDTKKPGNGKESYDPRASVKNYHCVELSVPSIATTALLAHAQISTLPCQIKSICNNTKDC